MMPAVGDSVGTSSKAAFSAGDDPTPEDPSPAPPTAPADKPPPPPPPPFPPPFPSVYNAEMVLVSGGVEVGSNYPGLPPGAPDEVRVRSDGPETIIGVQASGWPRPARAISARSRRDLGAISARSRR